MMSSDTTLSKKLPHSHVPYGHAGVGSYSKNRSDLLNSLTTPVVINALEKMPVCEGDIFTICDYGTADGKMSMIVMMEAVGWIKQRYGLDKEIHVIYEDQAVNDFTSVFKHLQGLLPGPRSYYMKYDNVFATACGTSFFQQCLPKNSVNLAFSSSSFHWLSKSPGTLEGAVMHLYCLNETEKLAFAEQAARDWETILLMRAKELKSGGQLIISISCRENDRAKDRVKESIFQQLYECWSELVEEGSISQEEKRRAHLNIYFRTEAEFRAPFVWGSDVSKAGLRLISMQQRTVNCRFNTEWNAKGATRTLHAARKHAQDFVGTIRCWGNFTFLSALDDTRSEEEKLSLVDKLYQKYEDRVAAAPENHGMGFPMMFIHIAKD